MKPSKLLLYIGLPVVGAVLGAKFSPAITQSLFDSVEPKPSLESQHYDLAADSVFDGQTLQIEDGRNIVKVRLCGIQLPNRSLDAAAREHLSALLAKGNGRITLVPVSAAQDNKVVAEAFVPILGTAEEIHLNSQLLLDEMAKIDEQSIYSCPNKSVMQRAAAQTLESGI